MVVWAGTWRVGGGPGRLPRFWGPPAEEVSPNRQPMWPHCPDSACVQCDVPAVCSSIHPFLGVEHCAALTCGQVKLYVLAGSTASLAAGWHTLLPR